MNYNFSHSKVGYSILKHEEKGKVNQSSACWAPKANPQPGLWVVPKASQPSLVVVGVGVELTPMGNQSYAHQGKEEENKFVPSSC